MPHPRGNWWGSIAIMATTALGASAATYLIVQPEEVEQPAPVTAREVASQDLINGLDALSSRVPALESSAPNRPVQLTTADTGEEMLTTILDRLDDLEVAVARLESATPAAREQALNSYIESATLPTPAMEYAGNERGEERYTADDGKPLGNYAEAIPEALHALGDKIVLGDIHCKTSVCRISFSDSGRNGERLNLADHLSGALGDADLDVHYGRDAAGQRVMYLQVR